MTEIPEITLLTLTDKLQKIPPEFFMELDTYFDFVIYRLNTENSEITVPKVVVMEEDEIDWDVVAKLKQVYPAESLEVDPMLYELQRRAIGNETW